GVVTQVQSPSNSPPVLTAIPNETITGELQCFVTGSIGSKYVIQASENLEPSDWIPLATNSAPLTFTDTNSGPSPLSGSIARCSYRDGGLAMRSHLSASASDRVICMFGLMCLGG